MPATRRRKTPGRKVPARKAPARKLDLYAAHKKEYAATRTPKLQRMRRARYLAISGKGKPGDPAFQESIGAIYTMAYTLKMARKFAGKDFRVSMLEGLYWWSDDAIAKAIEDCQWQLLIRVPTFITEREVRAAAAQLIEKGKSPRVNDVALVDLQEGLCVQLLHVGPYDAEQASIDEMMRFASSAGHHFAGKHHEIYLSDPRRVPPERLKTILRQPVA